MKETLKLNAGMERMLYFVLVVLLFTHGGSCFWYYIAKLDNLGPDTWVAQNGYLDASNFEIYVTSCYYIFTTITTVGYGDISGQTVSEK